MLFDGWCHVCDAYVGWIDARDPLHRFAFAPLQGVTAQALLARHPELPPGLDSIVYVERTDGTERLWWRSDALIEIAAQLPIPWRWLAGLRHLPRPLRDLGYRAFAASRYALFGRRDACRVPTEQEQGRMLP